MPQPGTPTWSHVSQPFTPIAGYDSDEDPWDEPVAPIRSLGDDDLGVGLPRASNTRVSDEQWRKMINSIPLDADAPVGTGRRRLVRRRDIDNDDVDDESSEEEDELPDEETIEADRKKVEEAAKRLGCKKVIVKVIRREQVNVEATAEETLPGVVKAEIDNEWKMHVKPVSTQVIPLDDDENKENITDEKNPPTTPLNTVKTQSLGSKVFFDLDDDDDEDKLPDDIFASVFRGQKRKIEGNSSDDDDMVLRKPGERKPKKTKKVKAVITKFENIDELETIKGSQIGKLRDTREYRDVVEEKVRWRAPGMRTPLFEHQVLGVDWMVNHEVNSTPRGGIVMDAMGMGKTIQTISTMALNLYDDEEYDASVSGVTLIVAPVALLPQWKEEILKHSNKGIFDVRIHHGESKIKNLGELRRCDVVLCSYNAIMNSIPPLRPVNSGRMSREEREIWFEEQYQKTRGMFHRIKFFRIVLDESHMIKNPGSRTSVACQRLEAEYKWCLSGTPIVNDLKDIYPVFSVLRHPTAGTHEGFLKLLSGAGPAVQGQRIQAVLRGCSMRRTKNDMLMGRPLIQLPKKRERLVELDFTPDERALYDFILQESKNSINKALSSGKLDSGDYSKILVLLLRLRQCVSHPWLILNSVATGFNEDQITSLLASFRENSPLHRAFTSATTVATTLPSDTCTACKTYTTVFPTRCKHVQLCVDCHTEITECPRCNKLLTGAPADANLPPLPPFIYSTKTRALTDQLLVWRDQNPGQKIILYSLFTQLLDLVQEMLQSDPVFATSITFARYQGSMSLEDRETSLQQFRTDPNCSILLTSMKAGGIGLNLTDASLVLSLDLWWNRATEDQAFARVHRLGQTKEVEVVRLIVRDTVEQRILQLQKMKMRVAGAALGEGEMKLGRLTMDELLGLFGTVERDASGRRRLM